MSRILKMFTRPIWEFFWLEFDIKRTRSWVTKTLSLILICVECHQFWLYIFQIFSASDWGHDIRREFVNQVFFRNCYKSFRFVVVSEDSCKTVIASLLGLRIIRLSFAPHLCDFFLFHKSKYTFFFIVPFNKFRIVWRIW